MASQKKDFQNMPTNLMEAFLFNYTIFLPNSSHTLMTVSSRLLTYHFTLVLKCFKFITGYTTSWPGLWNVISPPRLVFLNSAPRLRSLNICSLGVSSLIPITIYFFTHNDRMRLVNNVFIDECYHY